MATQVVAIRAKTEHLDSSTTSTNLKLDKLLDRDQDLYLRLDRVEKAIIPDGITRIDRIERAASFWSWFYRVGLGAILAALVDIFVHLHIH